MSIFLIPIVLLLILLPSGLLYIAWVVRDENQAEQRRKAQEKQAELKARVLRARALNARQREHFFASFRGEIPMPILESDYEADENVTRELGDTWREAIDELDFEDTK